jgi:hypothetical protein
VGKPFAYKQHDCRPVMYLSRTEMRKLEIPTPELWRVVRLEASDKGWISWLHEREWRCEGDFDLPEDPGVLVPDEMAVKHLQNRILEAPKSFACKPRCILPLNVICQGLIY